MGHRMSFIGSAISATVRRHPIASELPALVVLGVGALLVQLGITETGPHGVLSQNVWFNLGIGFALGGLVLGLAIPVVYVVGEYRRQRVAEQLAHFSSEGTDVVVAVRTAFVSKAPVPVTEYDNWANGVEAVLRRIDATGSLVARFRSGAGLPLFPSQLEGAHLEYEGRVIARKARMNEFLAELR